MLLQLLFFTLGYLGIKPNSTFAERLTAPVVYLDAQFQVILKGDFVEVKCRAPPPFSTSTFHLFRNNLYLVSLNGTDTADEVNFVLREFSAKDEGLYSCQYQTWVSGKWTESEQSQPIPLMLTASLPKPSVALEPPGGHILRGQSLLIHCSAPLVHPNIHFHLYKGKKRNLVSSRSAPPGTAAVTFSIAKARGRDKGTYSCLYQIQRAGRALNSTHSDDLTVTVTDAESYLPMPTVYLNPSVYSIVKGETVRIGCAAPPSYCGCFFYLYKGSSHMVQSTSSLALQHTVAFTLRDLGVVDGGHYRCQYKCWITNQVRTSEFSDPLEITVKVYKLPPAPDFNPPPPPPPPRQSDSWRTLLICVSSAVVLALGITLLTVGIIVCNRERKKRQKQRALESYWKQCPENIYNVGK
nr:PREDICTED: immunoglobulin superfamily member 1-like [Latimeria chalumnae]|eukprot:XP_014342814.1 PREDICTED: immunoglobulin superfamily member 1-like [Latimeria chalumnae]